MEFFKDKEVNEGTLNALKYHELKPALEELGIPSVWKQGTKKVDMVKLALEKLASIKEAKAQGKVEGIEVNEEEVIEPIVETVIEDNPEVEGTNPPLPVKKEVIRPIVEKPKEITKAVKKVEEKPSEARKIVLLKRLKNVELNLLNGILSHRQILLKNRDNYSKELKDTYNLDWEKVKKESA